MYFQSFGLRDWGVWSRRRTNHPVNVILLGSCVNTMTQSHEEMGGKLVFKHPGSYDMIYWILANTANIALTSSRPVGIAGKLCVSTAVTSWQLQGQG